MVINVEKSMKRSATIFVFGLPEGSTENSVHIHFQKRKNGGGDIKEVEMLEGGKAMITFEDSQGRFITSYKRLVSNYYKSTYIFSVAIDCW